VKPFRFGLIGAPRGSGADWLATARRAVDLGYASLLMPDVVHLLAPGPALAAAAAVADIRVGTWVYAAPQRPAHYTAWEAHSLSLLTDGRFEFGIGTGRPDAAAAAARFGLPFGTPAQRLAQVVATLDALRELDGPDRTTPVLMAAGGPRARAVAAARADTVTLATGPLTPHDEVRAAVADLRSRAADRADEIELAINVFAVGDSAPPHIERVLGADWDTLVARRSLSLLPGDTAAMADELQRRRAEFGFSYVLVSAEFAEQLAPAVAALAGR
jgi:alkanesulfonate monooxygenase SsuD/methylene tetrahydromethanopterin reductase-like flavin-dependent oxidoreductase (luciferase family)